MPDPPIDTIIHADCMDPERGLPSLPGGCIDAVITDPPWMDYETNRYSGPSPHKAIAGIEPQEHAKLLYRTMRVETALLLWCRWDNFDAHKNAIGDAGFVVRNQIVWGKPNHTAGDLEGNVGNQHECAIFATKGRWQRHSARETNLWLEPHLFSRAYRAHPTQKPEGLLRRSVRLCCPPGGTVLDPFIGSGTTAVACVQTGRHYIGYEIDGGYCEIARQRVAEAEAQPRLIEPERTEPVQERLIGGDDD